MGYLKLLSCGILAISITQANAANTQINPEEDNDTLNTSSGPTSDDLPGPSTNKIGEAKDAECQEDAADAKKGGQNQAAVQGAYYKCLQEKLHFHGN